MKVFFYVSHERERAKKILGICKESKKRQLHVLTNRGGTKSDQEALVLGSGELITWDTRAVLLKANAGEWPHLVPLPILYLSYHGVASEENVHNEIRNVQGTI